MNRDLPFEASKLTVLLVVLVLLGVLASLAALPQLPDLGNVQLDLEPAVQPALASKDASAAPTYLSIPSIGVSTTVVNAPRTATSWDVSHLTWQVGHLATTAQPGQGSNVVLGGHSYLGINNANPARPGPFARLQNVQVGDEVQVQAGSQSYTYVVVDKFRVTARDVWVIRPSNNEVLTLLTCSTWNPRTLTFDKRLVVRAELVQSPPAGGTS